MKLRLWIGSGWGRERGLLGVEKSGAIIFGDLIGKLDALWTLRPPTPCATGILSPLSGAARLAT
jgi:hypothetical protein